MTTLAQLADRCQDRLSDAGAAFWTQAIIEQWCKEAVRVYSQFFPRIKTQEITCGAHDHEYDLSTDFLAVVSVEYPTGQDPKEYLFRRSYVHPDFWITDGYYDILERDDASDASEIWISDDSNSGQKILVQYQAVHDFSLSSSGTLTVPGLHEPLLEQYVYWLAMGELAANEASAPTSNSSLLMAQLDQIVGTVWRRGETLFLRARRDKYTPPGKLTWSMDKYSDRGGIY